MEFCVECGAQEKLYGHLCRDCLTRKELIRAPDHLQLVVCRGCGTVQRKSRWLATEPSDEVVIMLGKQTKSHSQVSELHWEVPCFEAEKGERKLQCVANLTIGSDTLSVEHELKVKVSYQMCPKCSRQSSDYFEVTIQLRREGLSAKHAVHALRNEDDKILGLIDDLGENYETGFLTRSEAVTGGIDYYLGSVSLGRIITRKLRDFLSADVSESKSLVGMKDGRDMYRWTILVKLPSVASGDVVLAEGSLHVVDTLGRGSITLRSLTTGTKMRIKASTNELRLVLGRNDIQDAIVVSQEGNTLQVLDPDSMRTESVLLPPDYKVVGETVPVVRYKDELYLI